MTTAAAKKILCLGEISWDSAWVVDKLPTQEGDYHVLEEYEGPGGCALNSAFALAANQTPVFLAGNALGNDETGKKIIAAALKKNINHNLFQQIDVQTPQCQILVEKQTGKRLFILRHTDIQKYSEKIVTDLAERTRNGEFPYAFVQLYLKDLSNSFLTRVQDFKESYLMSQDIGPESAWIPYLNAIQISLPDDAAFSETSVMLLAKPYFRGRCAQVFLTAGKRGVACCQRDGKIVLQPGLPVRAVVDTTGCGDAFRAGLLKGLFEGRPLALALQLGQEIAANKAQKKGSSL